MSQNYMDYKGSGKEWEQSYIQGLDLLGFKYENRTEPFQGASGATHPVISRSSYTVPSTSLQRIITKQTDQLEHKLLVQKILQQNNKLHV